jgi:hydroxyethylthiazole kinase-like uncharacterized protein yjeF
MHHTTLGRIIFRGMLMDTLLYSVDEIRAIEHSAAGSLAPGELMRRAGSAAAHAAMDLLDDARELPVLVLAGPGNNGGDALEVACRLRESEIEVLVLYLAGENAPSPEAAQAMQRACELGVRFVDTLPSDLDVGLVVDGLFGIGLARALDERCAGIVSGLDRFDCPVLALDVPSGLDADTGAIVGGAAGVAVKASHTLTFIGDKPGLHTCDGRDYAGEVHIDSLGIETRHFVPARARLNGPETFAVSLQRSRRAENSHKGSFGDVAVVGGAQGMAGAPILAARAALFLGAGRVFVAGLAPLPPYDSVHPELMFRDAFGFDFGERILVAGPGLGDSHDAVRLLSRVLDHPGSLVLDADALNGIASNTDLQSRLVRRNAPTILTPHPLEAARLLGVTGAIVQADRLAAARELAARLSATVVLKGSGSVIAARDGDVVINTTGNPGLATAGSGDVLAGFCGALLAQGWDEWEAALCAVWLHGASAEALVYEGVGPIGLTAGELPQAARALFNAMVKDEEDVPSLE